MKVPFIFLKEVSFSVTTNNATWHMRCTGSCFPGIWRTVKQVIPFGAIGSWFLGLVLQLVMWMIQEWIDVGIARKRNGDPLNLWCRTRPIPALNTLTFGSQVLEGTKVIKWQTDRKDIILNVCNFLFGCNSDLQLYKMGLMEKLCLHNNNNFILWNQFCVKEVLFKKVTLCSRA